MSLPDHIIIFPDLSCDGIHIFTHIYYYYISSSLLFSCSPEGQKSYIYSIYT